MYEQKFREGLSEVLKERGLKSIAVAQKSNIRPDTFSRILNGKRRIYADEMAAICNTLGLTVEEIMDKTAEKKEM